MRKKNAQEHAGVAPANPPANPSGTPGGWNDNAETLKQKEEGSLLAAGARWASGAHTSGVLVGVNVKVDAASAPNRREYPSLGADVHAADAEADADLYARRHDPSGKRWDDDERKGGVPGSSSRGGGGGPGGGRGFGGRPAGDGAYGGGFGAYEGSDDARDFRADRRDVKNAYPHSRDADGWPVRRGDVSSSRPFGRRRVDDDEEDPFAKAEAEERDFRLRRGGAAANETNQDAFGGAVNEAPRLERLRDGFLSGSGLPGLSGTNPEPPLEASFAGPGHAGGYGAKGVSREPISNGFGASRDGDISMPPPRGAFAADDFARGGAKGALSFGRRDASQTHEQRHANVHRAFADVSLDRSREGPRAPPLPPGAPPGAPRRPGPAPPEEAERDAERDAFQAELERVVAEQEAERRRRENVGNAMAGADAEKTGAPFAAGRSGGAPGAGADVAPAAEWRRTARELAGSALVSHPPPPPGPPPGAHSHAPYEMSASASGIAEDAETRNAERKKRGGRRVREAEERRAAKASENASSSSSAPGASRSTHAHHGSEMAHRGSDPASSSSSVQSHGTGLGLGMGQGKGTPGAPAAGGWGAGALGGLAWAGPIAEIQRSASSDALAHAARARMTSDPGAPGRADAAAAMSSAAAAAAAAAAHHHQAAAASNAFAYESAIAALGALVDRRPVGPGPAGAGLTGAGSDDRGSGGHPSSQHHTRNPGLGSVPRPAFGVPPPGAGSVGAPIGGPIGSVGLGFGGGMWSAAGPPPPPGAPPLPPGPPPPGPPPQRGGAQGGAAFSPGGAAATLVAAAALEDD